jgi:hypothetical protein
VNSTASLPPVVASEASIVASSRTKSSWFSATTTARCSNSDRVVASEKPRSVRSVDGRAATWSACARNDSGDRADRTKGTSGNGLRSAFRGFATSVACSRIRWAFVPPMPNADTPARRGRSFSGHARASVSSSTEPEAQSTCGEGSSTCSVLGAMPCRIAWTILITPATPAADWAWPMLDLSEPSRTGFSRSWP